MKKSGSLTLFFCVFLFISFLVSSCGTSNPSSSNKSFMQEMAESLADSAAKQSQSSGSTSSIQSSSAASVKTAVSTPPGFSGPDSSGWYTQSVTGMSLFKLRFWADLAETTYITFGAWATPHHVEVYGQGSGKMPGETATIHLREDFQGSNYGSISPQVYVISSDTATYEITTKNAITLNPVVRGTGTITAESSRGTMNVTALMYASNESQSHIVRYASHEASGTMADSSSVSHTITARMQEITESGSEKLYGLIYDSGTLKGIMNITIASGEASGTLLDMSQTPWQKVSISTQ